MQTQRNVVFLALLTCAPASAQTLFVKHDGDLSSQKTGWTIAPMSDLDGDGFDEYIVGSGGLGGYAEVISGHTGAVIYDYHEVGCYGMALGDLGDVTGDGTADFAVGAPREEGIGSVRIYSGADGSLEETLWGTNINGRFGYALTSAGDVDGDTIGDMIVGSFWDSTNIFEAGSATVFSGADWSVIHHVEGDLTSEEWFGTEVCGVGDLNGDHMAEFLVGAPQQWYVPALNPPPGNVHLFDGATGNLITRFEGNNPGDHYGTSVAPLGDVNGDGTNDMVIGSPRHDENGSPVGMAEVRSGKNGIVLRRWFGTPWSMFGTSVASAGDLDQDGFDDVIVGACHCQNTFPISGEPAYAQIFSGFDGQLLRHIEGEALASWGFAVAGLGDLTGDGIVDFGIGSPHTPTLGPETGKALVMSGVELSLTGDRHELSVSEGGSLALSLQAGGAHRFETYLFLSSGTGTMPGTLVAPGLVLPLMPDAFTQFTASKTNQAPYGNTLSELDIHGAGTASMTMPGGFVPAQLIGRTMWHAFILVDEGSYTYTSNAVPLTFLP